MSEEEELAKWGKAARKARMSKCPFQNYPCDSGCALFCRTDLSNDDPAGGVCAIKIIARQLVYADND